ncbi:MAG: PIN domain-containing protein [Cyanobacteria bacterium P01_A01_bin.17]
MIIVDTGFWLALANRRDTHHLRATEVLTQFQEPLITTWPVITETCYLLLKRLGTDAQERFILNLAQGAFSVFDLAPKHSLRIQALMSQYCNLPMDLADASLVILAEYLKHGRIFSVDERDFNAYRWKNRQPFENLMLHDTQSY